MEIDININELHPGSVILLHFDPATMTQYAAEQLASNYLMKLHAQGIMGVAVLAIPKTIDIEVKT